MWYREGQYRWDNFQISKSDCTAKILRRYRKTPFLLAVSCSQTQCETSVTVKGGLGMRLRSKMRACIFSWRVLIPLLFASKRDPLYFSAQSGSSLGPGVILGFGSVGTDCCSVLFGMAAISGLYQVLKYMSIPPGYDLISCLILAILSVVMIAKISN